MRNWLTGFWDGFRLRYYAEKDVGTYFDGHLWGASVVGIIFGTLVVTLFITIK